jgi:hypothetical protein
MLTNYHTGTGRSSTYGFKPKQNIPESDKTEEWAMENVDWCISMSPLFVNQKVEDWYSLYNGKRTQAQFDHITKTYGVEFPAGALKHIPLVRPLLNRLLSEAEERQFEFAATSTDSDSIEDKIKNVSGKLIKDILKIVASEEDPEMAIAKLRSYYQEEYKSEMEIGVQHFLNQYIGKHRLERTLSDSFLDKIITGQQFYQVKVNRIGEDPRSKIIKTDQLFYADNDKKWVAECDWAVHPVPMTPTEVLDFFGERMKKDDIGKVESYLDMYHKNAYYRLGSEAEADKLINDSGSYTTGNRNTNVTDDRLTVYFVEWKTIRKVTYLENENKYAPDAPFIKIMSDEALRELPSSRKKLLKTRYIQDLWEGVRIGDDIYVDLGKAKYPMRSMSEPSKVFLSFNGLTHNGKVKPYSLIGETEDLQNLYDILHYHKENLIALSGVRGNVMDLSQLPNFGTGKFSDNLKMFMYYKKMGTAFIDRNKEGADRTFNQFPTYDDTLGSGLDSILKMIEHIEAVAGRMVGINRQQLGQTMYADGKSTMQQAIDMSSMVTEYLFNEHDEFVERMLTDIANAARVAYKEGVVGHYTDNKRMQHIFRLDDANFPFADWGIHITNRHGDKRSIQELKMMSAQLIKDGLMGVEDMLPMFKQTGLAEIMRQIEVNVTKRQMMMQEQSQQLQALQAQLEQAKGEAETQKLQATAQELMSRIEDNKRKLQLEKEALELDANYKQQEIDNDKERIRLEAAQLQGQLAQGQKVKSAEIKNN